MSTPTLAPTLRGYRRKWLAPDLIAAATLLVIAVPEQLATSRLAGMPPIAGLYAFIAGSLVFALLGSSPQVSVGADSTIAPLFAAGLGVFASTDSAHYGDLVGILAVMSGVIVAAVWLLRLGWVAEFLSAPIIAGFLAGIGVVIVVHQLPDLLGVAGGGSSTLGRLKDVVDQLNGTCAWTVVIGLGVFAIVTGFARFSRRVPGALIALVAATALVAILGLQHHGVAILGHVANGAPSLGLRGLSLHTLGEVAPVAAIVALVVVTQSAATTRAFEPAVSTSASAAGPGREVSAGRDLMAVGAGNILAGLVGAFPVNASPPRTAAVAQAGGRTQLAGLVAALVMIALVPAAAVLHDVPVAALAGVLLFIATRIVRVGELRAVARFDRVELALALVTLVTVALLGVEQGIGVAVALAILDRTRLTARPQLHVLGRIPGTTSWAPLSGPDRAAPVGDVLVVLFATPLWYANSAHFRAQLRDAIAAAPGGPPRAIVLDALGMSDIDYTGALALRGALDELDAAGIGFAIARAGAHVRAELRRAGLSPQRIPENRFFPAVDAAVSALTRGTASDGPVKA
ncbi:MAG TPA: SulP family inorganic anion transporter [Solirubrobacteraceae bacterium]|nr:SulP family inorganic anion transporter [Solirubrobacteraceae bacterium]